MVLSKRLLSCLAENRFFDNVEEARIAKLDNALIEERAYEPGDLIIEQDTESDEIYLIISGVVKITRDISTGEEIELFQREAKEFIGESFLIEGKRRSANAYALTSTRVIVIKRDAFVSILGSLPEIETNVAVCVSDRLTQSDSKATNEISRNIELLRLNQRIEVQKKELEAQKVRLQELNATKDRFFSIISHDLRSPLASMMGMSELLDMDFDSFSKDEMRTTVSLMHNSSKRLYELLENLLQWSRSQTGGLKYRPRRVDLSSVTSRTLALMEQNAHAKKIDLHSEVGPGTFVFADEEMLAAVIRNLLSNALKFTTAGGRVRILSVAKDDSVEVSISDNGVGMEESDTQRLFKLAVHHTTLGTSEEKGTGLGLILCQEFIGRHGGRIWVESKPGKGSTFRFTLPKEP